MNKSWGTKRLGDFLQRVERFEARDDFAEYHFAGTYSYAKGIFPGERKTGSSFRLERVQRIHEGDFVYCKIMAWEGAFGIVPLEADNCVMSGAFVAYEIDTTQIVPRYLEYLFKLEKTWKTIGGQSTGTNVRRRSLHPHQLEAFEIPLPPLDEQQRIVAQIDAVAAQIAEARGLRQGAVEEAERIEKSATIEVFDKKIQELKWELKPITKAVQIARGKFSFRPRNDPRFYGGNIPFIQIGDISKSTKYIEEYSQTLNEAGLGISRLFPIGTVVIAITGATIGATGILTFASCFPDSIVGLTAIEGITTSEYTYWALEYAKQSALDEAKTTTQPNINLEKLKRVLIPIPPVAEQTHIADYLNELQKNLVTLRIMQIQTAAELDALLPSLLDRAFKGEL